VFECPGCRKVYKARVEDGGKMMKCKVPECGVVTMIPGGSPSPSLMVPSPVGEDVEPEDESKLQTTPTLWRDPVKLALSVATIAGCFAVLFLLFLSIALSKEPPPVGLLVIAVVMFVLSAVSGCCALQLFTAKQRVITTKRRSVPVFFGLARLITWEQNEGLILLRDKKISETIYGPKSGGGIHIIYPLLGEELRAQVPLTLQLTWFRDERVMTRESIQLVVKVAIWWEICDLEAYFYRIDREVHSLDDRNLPRAVPIPGEGVVTRASPTLRGPLAIAEVWVRTVAEICLRKLITGTSLFLMVSKSEGTNSATAEVVPEQLKTEIKSRLNGYGLEIERVEIQEVQLPAAIQQAVHEVWVAASVKTKSKHDAEATRHRLQVLVDLLGRDNAALREIVDKLPAGAFFGCNPFAPIIAQLGALGAASGVAAVGALLPPATSSVLPSPPSKP
jgi:regulator of protease activity HflC (stomatin/prohibitin superfamily)